jgi:hypothetical protein
LKVRLPKCRQALPSMKELTYIEEYVWKLEEYNKDVNRNMEQA